MARVIAPTYPSKLMDQSSGDASFTQKEIPDIRMHSVRSAFEGMAYSRLSKVKATMQTHYSLYETQDHALREYKAMLLEPFISAWCSFWPGK